MSNVFEHQNQILIRFPQNIADQLHKYFNQGGDQPQVTLEVDPTRKQTVPRIGLNVGVNGTNYKATVFQSPTVTSSFKTIDRINFFKSSDVSEMIVVHESQYDQINQSQAQKILVHGSQKVKKYLSQSGITQPTNNIRQNNFRQRPKVDIKKVQQVDRSLQSIKQQFTNQGKQEQKNQKNKKKKL